VYHWAGQLAPERWAPIASYICGWFNFLGNAAGDASFAYGFANFVVAAQQIRKCPVDIGQVFADAEAYGIVDDYMAPAPAPAPLPAGAPPYPAAAPVCTVYGTGAQVGIAMAICFCWALMNISRTDQQGWLNNLAAGWQIATTVAIVATLLAHTGEGHDFQSNHFVWEIWRNRTGFSMDNGGFGYVILAGLASSLFSFTGYEAGAHMAEETTNASVSSAHGLIYTTTASALTGLLYILGCLYAIPAKVGIFTALHTYDVSISSLYAVATGNKVGLILTNVLVANLFVAGMSSFTVTTRITFALARDGAFPGSTHLRKVHDRTKSPIGSVALVLVVDCLLLLLPLATISGPAANYGAVAFNAVTSVCAIGYQISYCIPILLRCTVAAKSFEKSAFHMGRLSLPIAWISWFWLFITSCFMFWPTVFPVNVYNMNWTIVVVAGCGFIAAVYWMTHARHVFKGALHPGRVATSPPLLTPHSGPKRVDAAVFREIALQASKAEAGQ
jgi:amino acid transporter